MNLGEFFLWNSILNSGSSSSEGSSKQKGKKKEEDSGNSSASSYLGSISSALILFLFVGIMLNSAMDIVNEMENDYYSYNNNVSYSLDAKTAVFDSLSENWILIALVFGAVFIFQFIKLLKSDFSEDEDKDEDENEDEDWDDDIDSPMKEESNFNNYEQRIYESPIVYKKGDGILRGRRKR